jgi:hypothetical protein
MNFVVDNVALWLVLLRIFLFSPVNIISPMIHTHLQPYAVFTRRADRRINGTFQKAMLFSEIEEHGIESAFIFVSLRI